MRDAAEGERRDEQRYDGRSGRAASVGTVVSRAAAGTWLRGAPALFEVTQLSSCSF